MNTVRYSTKYILDYYFQDVEFFILAPWPGNQEFLFGCGEEVAILLETMIEACVHYGRYDKRRH